MKKQIHENIKMPTLKKLDDIAFQKRLEENYEEIYKIYSDLYHNDSMFDSMIIIIYDFNQKRTEKLKKLDEERLITQNWYCTNDSIVIQLYTEKFTGTLKGIEEKLDYLQKLGIKYIYALPFLKSPPGKSDGGFACSDFRNVREDLGTIEDLEHLISSLHERGMCFIMDCVISNTSDEHEWAKRAKKGEIEYQKRYHFFDNWRIPNKFDSYGVMDRYFGDIAPDNFTFVPEIKKIVMTTYYPYQWDLNYKNPIVFNEILSNILFLANLGVDIIFFDGAENLWKKAGTNCHNLVPSYAICQLIYLVMQIVCPGVETSFNLKRHKKNANIPIDASTGINDSEIETEFLLTESGVLVNDDIEDIELTRSMQQRVYMDEEEDDNDIDIDFDITKEIGKIHKNNEWISRLWGSLAMGDVNSIKYSINSISNSFNGECQMTKVHTHDDINWNNGFGVQKSSFIGNGIGMDDQYRGGILTLHRYFNDYYLGNMPGSFSKGELFAESMVTGKARICGSTASLLGLEKSLIEEEELKNEIEKNTKKHKKKSFSQKHVIAKNRIQSSINRILLLHAVTGSMPSMFFIYYGDEVGKLNDYSYQNCDEISYDSRYLHRGKINWDLVDLVDSDENSYQSKIFNGIKDIINARISCPFFTESKKTVFINSYSNNEYFDIKIKRENNSKTKCEIDNSILIFKRIRNDNHFIIFVFNFCEYAKDVRINESDANGRFKELISGKIYQQINNFKIDGYGYLWLDPIEN